MDVPLLDGTIYFYGLAIHHYSKSKLFVIFKQAVREYKFTGQKKRGIFCKISLISEGTKDEYLYFYWITIFISLFKK